MRANINNQSIKPIIGRAVMTNEERIRQNKILTKNRKTQQTKQYIKIGVLLVVSYYILLNILNKKIS